MAPIEPSDSVVGRPELARLVDVNLARLLRVGFPELLADAERLQPGGEDAEFTAQIGGATEPQGGRQVQLGLVQPASVGVGGQVEHVGARPFRLEALGVPRRERRRGGRVIRESAEVGVFGAFGARRATLRGGRPARGGRHPSLHRGRRFGRPLRARARRSGRGGLDGPFRRLGRRGSDLDRFGPVPGLRADALRLPVLLLRLFAGSLHVRPRVPVVGPPQGREEGQREEIFLPRGLMGGSVGLDRVHGHVIRYRRVRHLLGNCDRRFDGEERLRGRDAGRRLAEWVQNRVSQRRPGALVVPLPLLPLRFHSPGERRAGRGREDARRVALRRR